MTFRASAASLRLHCPPQTCRHDTVKSLLSVLLGEQRGTPLTSHVIFKRSQKAAASGFHLSLPVLVLPGVAVMVYITGTKHVGAPRFWRFPFKRTETSL